MTVYEVLWRIGERLNGSMIAGSQETANRLVSDIKRACDLLHPLETPVVNVIKLEIPE